jgi:hypothetical protein
MTAFEKTAISSPLPCTRFSSFCFFLYQRTGPCKTVTYHFVVPQLFTVTETFSEFSRMACLGPSPDSGFPSLQRTLANTKSTDTRSNRALDIAYKHSMARYRAMRNLTRATSTCRISRCRCGQNAAQIRLPNAAEQG